MYSIQPSLCRLHWCHLCFAVLFSPAFHLLFCLDLVIARVAPHSKTHSLRFLGLDFCSKGNTLHKLANPPALSWTMSCLLFWNGRYRYIARYWARTNSTQWMKAGGLASLCSVGITAEFNHGARTSDTALSVVWRWVASISTGRVPFSIFRGPLAMPFLFHFTDKDMVSGCQPGFNVYLVHVIWS